MVEIFSFRHRTCSCVTTVSVSATAGTTGGGGNGGNITIDSGTLTVLENSDIVANAYQGLGGKIHIDTQGLFLAPNSQITASSIRGINGIVDINTPLNNLQTALTPLEGELVSTEQVVADSCRSTPQCSSKEVSPSLVTGGLAAYTLRGDEQSVCRGWCSAYVGGSRD